jgi:hypothetical protein
VQLAAGRFAAHGFLVIEENAGDLDAGRGARAQVAIEMIDRGLEETDLPAFELERQRRLRTPPVDQVGDVDVLIRVQRARGDGVRVIDDAGESLFVRGPRQRERANRERGEIGDVLRIAEGLLRNGVEKLKPREEPVARAIEARDGRAGRGIAEPCDAALGRLCGSVQRDFANARAGRRGLRKREAKVVRGDRDRERIRRMERGAGEQRGDEAKKFADRFQSLARSRSTSTWRSTSVWILSIFSTSPGSVLTVIEWMLLATV